MSNNDTSDEALEQFCKFYSEPYQKRYVRNGWREAVRRCEVLIELKDKALKLAHVLHQEEMEERERKAFEAGIQAWFEDSLIDFSQLDPKWLNRKYRSYRAKEGA